MIIGNGTFSCTRRVPLAWARRMVQGRRRMQAEMRKPLVCALLVGVALLATVSAAVDWLRLDGARDGHGYGFFGRGGYWFDDLVWLTRPPTTLLFTMVLVAWGLVVLALRRPGLASKLALPAAVLVAVLMSIGSVLPFGSLSREVTTELTLVPAAGLWVAVASLALAAVTTAAGMWPRINDADSP